MAFGSVITASAGIADRDQGLAGGVINTSRLLGAATGAALFPAVAEAFDRTRHTRRQSATGRPRWQGWWRPHSPRSSG
ncbi:hypothetical protein [Streptomyces sp. NPDC054783]